MRFSLRTLLIVILLGGPVCAYVASWFVEDYRVAAQRQIDQANKDWWRKAVKSSRVENGHYIISIKTQKEFETRFGHPIVNQDNYWHLESPKSKPDRAHTQATTAQNVSPRQNK